MSDELRRLCEEQAEYCAVAEVVLGAELAKREGKSEDVHKC